MTRGGKRIRAGRRPDPDSLKRGTPADIASWTILDPDAAELKEPPPPFPLPGPTPRELEVWAESWRQPQAIMWRIQSQEAEVALYVRSYVEAESPRATSAQRTIAARFMDSLGLTTGAMAGFRWRIGDPKVEATPAPRGPMGRPPGSGRGKATGKATAGADDLRDRLRVVDGDRGRPGRTG